MKSAVKIVKSFQADSSTISAMFFGYFVLLAVTAAVIFSSVNTDHSSMATSKVKTEQTLK
jgi:hypothetical protein